MKNLWSRNICADWLFSLARFALSIFTFFYIQIVIKNAFIILKKIQSGLRRGILSKKACERELAASSFRINLPSENVIYIRNDDEDKLKPKHPQACDAQY